MDVEWTGEPEFPLQPTRVDLAVGQARPNVLETPSSPFASPSFLDCLAENNDRPDRPLQPAAVGEKDMRREEAQSKGRRTDVEWTEEFPLLPMRVDPAGDQARHKVLETPSDPFASPSFLDCLAEDYDWADSPLGRDPVALPPPLEGGVRYPRRQVVTLRPSVSWLAG